MKSGSTLSELRQRLDMSPMSPAQILAVIVTMALSALDGFDVLSVTFAAPAIARDWHLGSAALGMLLSAGLAGMAFGSFFLAPLADLWGRRRVVLVNLALMAVGMLASAAAPALPELIFCRVVTGLGIGAMVAVINPLAAEFANRDKRPFAMAMMTVGYPVGGLIGGVLAASIIPSHGWRSIFVAGSLGALLLLPFVLAWLPESPTFLLTRTSAAARCQLDAVLIRFGQPRLMAGWQPEPIRNVGYAGVFTRDQIARTAAMTSANFFYVLAVYYALSWLPQMAANVGFAPGQASLIGASANLSGIAGGLLVGYSLAGSDLRRPTALVMSGTALMVGLIGFAPASFPLWLAAAGCCGFLLFAGMAGLYTVLASSFAASARASGVGFVIGVGRIGSAIAPVLAGNLFATGLDCSSVSALFGASALLAALILLGTVHQAEPRSPSHE